MDNPEGDFTASSSTGPASLAGSAALCYPPRAGRSGAASLRETLLQQGRVGHPPLLLPGSLLFSLRREIETRADRSRLRMQAFSLLRPCRPTHPEPGLAACFGGQEQSCSLVPAQPGQGFTCSSRSSTSSCTNQTWPCLPRAPTSLRSKEGEELHQSWRGWLQVPSSSPLPTRPQHASLPGKRASRERGTASAGTGCARTFRALPSQVLRYPPQSNFLGNSVVAFPSLSPNKYHAKQDEYLLPRPSGMTHFLNQGRCNWALESWTPPKARRFCNNYSKKQKE